MISVNNAPESVDRNLSALVLLNIGDLGFQVGDSCVSAVNFHSSGGDFFRKVSLKTLNVSINSALDLVKLTSNAGVN
jgi:hypothetical protein